MNKYICESMACNIISYVSTDGECPLCGGCGASEQDIADGKKKIKTPAEESVEYFVKDEEYSGSHFEAEGPFVELENNGFMSQVNY